MPEPSNIGVINPIFKKGDKLACNNYRGITLLNVAYKIFSNILHSRLSVYIEERLGEYQAGFRPNRSTCDQIFAIRQAMEKAYEFQTDLHFIFVDFMQAFDKLNRTAIYITLEKYGVPHKLIRLVKLSLENTKAKVCVNNKMSELFQINSGVRQGDALSTLLFNITLGAAMENVEKSGTILTKSIQTCAYADDIALIAKREDVLRENFITLEKSAKKVGLTINENKTKYMTMSRRANRRNRQNYTIGDYNFEGVKEFTYLGTQLNNTNLISTCIQERIQAANRCYYANAKMLKSKVLSRKSKMKMYKSIIRPVMAYGAECWSMTTQDESALRIFERKVIRKIYGPIKINENSWRIRTNAEINELIGNADIVRFIKSQRIRWAGHVQRMAETSIPKKLLNGKMNGTRNTGRPRKRWSDDLYQDLQIMGVRNWKNVAQDRDIWRGIVKEAKAHTGL